MFRCLFSLLLFIPLFVTAQRIRPFPVLPNGKPKYEYMAGTFDGRVMVVNFEGKYGFVNLQWHEIIPCVFDSASSFSNGNAIVIRNNKLGLIDTNGREIIPCHYDALIDDHDVPYTFQSQRSYKPSLFIRAVSGTTSSIFDITTGQSTPISFEVVESHINAGFRIVKSDKLFGLSDLSGKIRLPIRYSWIWYSDGRFWLTENNKTGCLDTGLQVVIPIIYDVLHPFSNGLAQASINRCWGYVDTLGFQYIPLIYDEADRFTIYNTARVRSGAKCGLINKQGKVVAPFVYDNILHSIDELYIAVVNRKYGIIDTAGKIIADFIYDRIEDECKSCAKINGKSVNIELPPSYYASRRAFYNSKYEAYPTTTDSCTGYKKVYSFHNGLAAVQGAHGLGFIDTFGHEVIECKYRHVSDFHNGKANVGISDSLVGIINRQGKLVVPFHKVKEPSVGNLKVVWQNSLCGIQSGRKWIVPCVYRYVNIDDVITVRRNDSSGILDLSGKKFIVPFRKYKNQPLLENNRIFLHFDSAWQMTDKAGKLIKGFGSEITYINWLGAGYYRIKDTKKRWGLMDSNGTIVIPFSMYSLHNYSDGALSASFDINHYPARWQSQWQSSDEGIVDLKGRQLIPFMYESIGAYSKNGLIPVTLAKYDKVGFINAKNELVTPYMFDRIDCGEGSEGLYNVARDGNLWFINSVGQLVLSVTSPCHCRIYYYEAYETDPSDVF